RGDRAGDGLRLATLLVGYTHGGARRVDQGDDGQGQRLGQQEEALRLAEALRMSHAEVALHVFTRAAAFLVAHDHHGAAIEEGRAAHDGRIVAEAAVAVQLHKVGKGPPYVIKRV